MDTDSIVIQEPSELIINPEVKLAYRPVDHTLIGSTFSEPISPFWESIYSDCGVNESKIFPMTASVDENVIRPYFNAGMLDLRPEIGLLRSWRRNFLRLFKASQYEELFQVKTLYKIFFHQAVLAGTVLSSIDHAELQELPYLINYPLHMHRDYPKDKKPECLNDLITCRYDIFFNDPEWYWFSRIIELTHILSIIFEIQPEKKLLKFLFFIHDFFNFKIKNSFFS